MPSVSPSSPSPRPGRRPDSIASNSDEGSCGGMRSRRGARGGAAAGAALAPRQTRLTTPPQQRRVWRPPPPSVGLHASRIGAARRSVCPTRAERASGRGGALGRPRRGAARLTSTLELNFPQRRFARLPAPGTRPHACCCGHQAGGDLACVTFTPHACPPAPAGARGRHGSARRARLALRLMTRSDGSQ